MKSTKNSLERQSVHLGPVKARSKHSIIWGEQESMLNSYKLIFYPDDSIKEYVKDCRDIYQQRYLLRMIKYTNISFEYLVDIILDATRSGRKFRVLECL